MSNTKLLASILFIIAVMFAQVGNVAAAPRTQDGTTTLTGTIDEITTELDENGETIVIVTLTDEEGITQIVTLSAQEADENELFDLTTQKLLAEAGDPVELVVDPNDVVPDEKPTQEEDVHPIAWILAEFFNEEPGVVDGYHDEGFGFGVIAQALWMSRNITGTEEETGDASLAWDILQAKQEKDFQTFFNEHEEYFEDLDGDVPTNWGQFKKALLEKKNNLGVIVSGQAEENLEDGAVQQNQDNGSDRQENQNKQDKQKKDKKPKKH